VNILSASALAQTEIQWWHSMDGALNDWVVDLADGFNASQKDYKVVPVYKGNYDQSMTAGVAAVRLMDAYKAKTLDQQDCMDHIFTSITHLPINEVQVLVAKFVRAKILPIVYQAGLRLIQEHYDNGDDVMM